MKVNFLVVLIGLAVVQSSYAGVQVKYWKLQSKRGNCEISFQTLRDRRSIDLSAAHALIPDTKLPTAVVPNCYTLELRPDFEDNSFSGKVIINVTFVEDASEILLHAHSDLEIQQNAVTVREMWVFYWPRFQQKPAEVVADLFKITVTWSLTVSI